MTHDDRMETITDRAAIRASDEHDPWRLTRTTPAPSSGAGLDLDRLEAWARGVIDLTAEEARGVVAEVERLNLNLSVTAAQRDEVRAEVVTLRDTLTRRTESHTQLVRDNDDLRAKVAHLTNVNADLTREVGTLRAKVAAVEALEAEVERLRSLWMCAGAAHFEAAQRAEAADARADKNAAAVARVRELADRLAAALAFALHDAHPVYGSTAGWRHGIGGAAMTHGCSLVDPPPGMDWLEGGAALEDPLRDWLREFPDFDLAANKAAIRAALDGGQR
jgi:hypothetical protein